MTRLVLLLLAVSLFVAVFPAAPAAEAATRRSTDREARVRFTLDNRILTVRILRRAPRSVRRQLYGHRIRAACGPNYAFANTVRDVRVWPRGRRRVRFRFSRNISRGAKWCLIERARSRHDVAYVNL